MKKLPLFFAACGLALLANATPTLAQSTPPPVYTSCSVADSHCWADEGGARGALFGANNSADACVAEGQRANDYANYYRSQPFSQQNNDLTLYWDYYADYVYMSHEN